MRALAAALALAACVPAGTDPTASSLFPDAEGLQPAGTPLRIDFGRAEAGVVSAVTRLSGAPPVSTSVITECGAGPVRAVTWRNGLTLNFLEGDFVGWVAAAAPGAPRTASGLTPGMPEAALSGVAFGETSLGREFSSGGVYGLVDGGEVTHLWAGVTCFFR